MEERQKAAEAAVFDQTNLLPKKQLLTVFGALAVSLFICFVDQNGIGVALPTIGRELHAEATISWAGTSALIANTLFQVLYGRLSDLFGKHYSSFLNALELPNSTFSGRKTVFLSALALLGISDLLCGLSQNSTMLYVFRGLAGVANGGITSLAMMIVSDIITLKERGKYQGILGSCVGLGNMVGPFIAAAFVQHSTWRGLFWLISPLAALFCILCFFILPTPKDAPSVDFKAVSAQIDYWGIITGSIAIMLILIPVSGGGSYFAWSSPMVISMLVIGGCCMLAFLFIEHRVALLPMMPCKSWDPDSPRDANSISVALQTCTRVRDAPPERILRYCVLLTNLLSPTLLSERTTNVAYNVGDASATTAMRPDDGIGHLRPIHLLAGAVWRSHLVWVFSLDFGCRADLHVRPRHID
jgi:MFS family permease